MFTSLLNDILTLLATAASLAGSTPAATPSATTAGNNNHCAKYEDPTPTVVIAHKVSCREANKVALKSFAPVQEKTKWTIRYQSRTWKCALVNPEAKPGVVSISCKNKNSTVKIQGR